MTIRTALTVLLSVAAIIFSPLGVAEQMQRFGQYELHYIVIPTTMLKPEIAAEYDISRGKDRALVNVSVAQPRKESSQRDHYWRQSKSVGPVARFGF